MMAPDLISVWQEASPLGKVILGAANLALAGVALVALKRLTRPRQRETAVWDDTPEAAVEKFSIAVSDDELKDLNERLARTRFPDQAVPNEDWGYGSELNFIKSLVEHWQHKYDWRAVERRLNALPQFSTVIDGTRVHFIYVRNANPGARAIILTHGWPSTCFDFMRVIPELAAEFHIVCPSIPGYGFSEAPREPGYHVGKMARVLAKLMQRLGYQQYVAQGGDWGAIISAQMAAQDAAHCRGLHMNMVVALPRGFWGVMRALLSAPFLLFNSDERDGIKFLRHFVEHESGYSAIQGTKPQTLGYALNDSPAGLLAWIVEKWRTWSDCGGDLESVYSKDELITNVMIYWCSRSITSSTRLYCETKRADLWGKGPSYVSVPTAGAIFPKELFRVPRAWAAAQYNLKRWTRFDRGGHFAPQESPVALAADLRDFTRSLEWR